MVHITIFIPLFITYEFFIILSTLFCGHFIYLSFFAVRKGCVLYCTSCMYFDYIILFHDYSYMLIYISIYFLLLKVRFLGDATLHYAKRNCFFLASLFTHLISLQQ